MGFIKFLNKLKEHNLRVLLIRTDRIGDLVLSAAAAEFVKKHLPAAKVTFLVREYSKAVLENNPFVDEIITTDGLSLRELAAKIKAHDLSIAMYANKTAVYAPLFAKIPFRAGPFSKLRSVFLNIRVIQNRSKSIKNEAEYNLELLGRVFKVGLNEKIYPKIYLTEAEREEGAAYLLNKHGVNVKMGDSFLILHPGGGGSSIYLPKERFFRLAEMLNGQGVKFIITGSAEEIAEYKRDYKDFNETFLEEGIALRKFFSVISFARVFVAGSTGPIHSAGALGVKTIGFYPNLKTSSAIRWGVFRGDSENSFIFSPDVPPCKKCRLFCSYYPCMEKIDIEAVFKKIIEFVEK
jgi:ADP-heptose:LPS heptosyltransferase